MVYNITDVLVLAVVETVGGFVTELGHMGVSNPPVALMSIITRIPS